MGFAPPEISTTPPPKIDTLLLLLFDFPVIPFRLRMPPLIDSTKCLPVRDPRRRAGLQIERAFTGYGVTARHIGSIKSSTKKAGTLPDGNGFNERARRRSCRNIVSQLRRRLKNDKK